MKNKLKNNHKTIILMVYNIWKYQNILPDIKFATLNRVTIMNKKKFNMLAR